MNLNPFAGKKTLENGEIDEFLEKRKLEGVVKESFDRPHKSFLAARPTKQGTISELEEALEGRGLDCRMKSNKWGNILVCGWD